MGSRCGRKAHEASQGVQQVQRERLCHLRQPEEKAVCCSSSRFARCLCTVLFCASSCLQARRNFFHARCLCSVPCNSVPMPCALLLLMLLLPLGHTSETTEHLFEIRRVYTKKRPYRHSHRLKSSLKITSLACQMPAVHQTLSESFEASFKIGSLCLEFFEICLRLSQLGL